MPTACSDRPQKCKVRSSGSMMEQLSHKASLPRWLLSMPLAAIKQMFNRSPARAYAATGLNGWCQLLLGPWLEVEAQQPLLPRHAGVPHTGVHCDARGRHPPDLVRVLQLSSCCSSSSYGEWQLVSGRRSIMGNPWNSFMKCDFRLHVQRPVVSKPCAHARCCLWAARCWLRAAEPCLRAGQQVVVSGCKVLPWAAV